MTPKEINAAITSCKDRIKDLQNKPKFYMGKGKRERAIELENIKIEALEKQVPKKPKMQYGCTYLCPPDFGGEEFDEYGEIPHCPSCDRKLDENKYNCKCGQAIDWSEGE